MPNFKINQSQSGFAALYLTILVLAVSLTLTTSIFVLTSVQQKGIKNTIQESQSYYSAEAGIEDAIWRIKNSKPISSNYVIVIDTGQAAVSISNPNLNTRIIRVTGTRGNVSKTLEAQLSIQSVNPDFFYGAQVGAGGIQMVNLSQIQGNVYSNGSILGSAGAQITGTAQVAGLGNKISNANIGGDAYANICENSTVGGQLQSSSQSGCSFSSFLSTSSIPLVLPLPISDTQINDWRAEAQAGGIISGNQTLSGGSTFLGPVKVVGNLTLQNDAQLIAGGAIWVTGNIIVQNSARVRLSSSFGYLGGVILVDGTIILENNSVSSGSGQAGSYLLYLSTANLNPALTIKNNAQADILYTSSGWIQIENNTKLKEITGYGVNLQNNAVIIYESGLQNVLFTSGPGGSWQVESWKEVD